MSSEKHEKMQLKHLNFSPFSSIYLESNCSLPQSLAFSSEVPSQLMYDHLNPLVIGSQLKSNHLPELSMTDLAHTNIPFLFLHSTHQLYHTAQQLSFT